MHVQDIQQTYEEVQERPRERIFAVGPGILSDRDLLALLIGTGVRGRHVLKVAEEVLSLLESDNFVVGPQQLLTVHGLGKAKAAMISASLELARRIIAPRNHRIRFPADVYPVVSHYADRKQEHFLALSLNGAHEVIACRVVSVGLVNRTLVHPREVYADALTDRAAALVVAHNHPSGRTEPSPEDREVTSRLRVAGETLGVRLLDHVIFSLEGYYSFLEHGEM